MLSVVMAGGFLAVVFVRRRKFALGAAAGLGVAAGLAILGGTALANIGPPPETPPPPSVVLPVDSGGQQIVVETIDAGNEVVLIIGRSGLPFGK